MNRLAVLTAAAAAALVVAPTASAHAAAVSAQDKQYLQKSAAGDIFEIKGGHMAEQKGQSQAIRSLGARLVKDHTKSLSDTRDLAKKLGVSLPSQPDSKMQAMLNQFSSASGSSFDSVYAKDEVSDHHEDISDATKEVSNGSNTEVTQDAQQELPVLRTHLALSEQALAAVSGSSTGSSSSGASVAAGSGSPSSVSAGSGGGADRAPLLPSDVAVGLAAGGALLAGWSIRKLRTDS